MAQAFAPAPHSTIRRVNVPLLIARLIIFYLYCVIQFEYWFSVGRSVRDGAPGIAIKKALIETLSKRKFPRF